MQSEDVWFFDPDEVPPRNPEIIKGVLRAGHKMILSAPSKAGKSFLATELALAVSQGERWLGLQCEKGVVLYVNFELDRAEFENRMADILVMVPWKFRERFNLPILHLRGKSLSLDETISRISTAAGKYKPELVVIDPLYKMLDGVDENSNSEMAGLLKVFDRLMETGCAVLIVHHYAKGGGRGKDQIDRAAGAGAIARDADTFVTMSEIPLSTEQRQLLDFSDTDPAFRVEFSLRAFPKHRPIGAWFRYPIHILDEQLLDFSLDPKTKKPSPSERVKQAIGAAREMTLEELAEAVGVTTKTIRNWEKNGKISGFEIAGGRLREK